MGWNPFKRKRKPEIGTVKLNPSWVGARQPQSRDEINSLTDPNYLLAQGMLLSSTDPQRAQECFDRVTSLGYEVEHHPDGTLTAAYVGTPVESNTTPPDRGEPASYDSSSSGSDSGSIETSSSSISESSSSYDAGSSYDSGSSSYDSGGGYDSGGSDGGGSSGD